MNNLLKRAISGALFVAILIGSITWNPYSYFLLFLLITIVGLWEFYGLAEKTGSKPQKVLGALTGAILFSLITFVFQGKLQHSYLALALLPVFFIFIRELYTKSVHPFNNIAYTLLGILYIALPFSLLSFLAMYNEFPFEGNYNASLLLGYFFLIWTNDTGAYLVGTKFGKKRLFERISPKKSWEGSIGGAFLSLAIAYIISLYFDQVSVSSWMIIACIVVVFGTLGDLVESLFKRSINAKDSGTILPGHGGILDRFDGVFISAPVVYVYLQIII